MSDGTQSNPLTDEVVAAMVEEGGVPQVTEGGVGVPQVAVGGREDELVAPPSRKGCKPRASSHELLQTRQFGTMFPLGQKVDISKIISECKKARIESMTHFHTAESVYQQQVCIFWVQKPWNKKRCVAFTEHVGGSVPIFKFGKDKHATIENQYEHPSEQKQMRTNKIKVWFSMCARGDACFTRLSHAFWS